VWRSVVWPRLMYRSIAPKPALGVLADSSREVVHLEKLGVYVTMHQWVDHVVMVNEAKASVPIRSD